MKPPTFLVLLAAFNGSRWIEEQIQSILAQRSVLVDIVVSDDGSSDDTRARVAQLGNPRVRLIGPPSPTGSAGQHFFWLIRQLSADSYDFVGFADQDDIWEPEKLVSAISALASHGGQGYSCAVNAFWPDGRTKLLRQADRLRVSDFLFEGGGQGCTYVLTAAFYARVREFLLKHVTKTREIHYHDWAVYALARSWNLKWVFDPKPRLRYRQHGTNDTGARFSIDGIHKRLGLIAGGWYFRQMVAIAGLCHAAAPTSAVIAEWRSALFRRRGIFGRLRLVKFCSKGGRRRVFDKLALMAIVFIAPN